MSENVKVFDYIALSKKCGVEQDELKKIIDEVYVEFENDEMLTELHIVRAIRQAVLKRRKGALI
jgi:hypothetical protein